MPCHKHPTPTFDDPLQRTYHPLHQPYLKYPAPSYNIADNPTPDITAELHPDSVVSCGQEIRGDPDMIADIATFHPPLLDNPAFRDF
eukprot:757413-Hanusia_phi.AAC.2